MKAPRDAKILLVSVFLRRASFGLTNQILALFLETVGISKPRIGTFMALTLVGDAAMSLVLTWFSDSIGRRLVMVIGCVLMVAAGAMFTLFLGFWVLLAAAIVGVISTLGDETGPFKTVEEACLAHLTAHGQKSHIFALYGFLGTLGSACGAQLCGVLVEFWAGQGWSLQRCYRAAFVVYCSIAGAKLALAVCLSDKCEVGEACDETEPLITSGDGEMVGQAGQTVTGQAATGQTEQTVTGQTVTGQSKSKYLSLGVSLQLRKHLIRLLPIFMLDSFGYGFMPPAWIVYYFQNKYHASPSTLGTLFFSTNIVDLVSSVASAYTFSMFGPVKAILVAQVPSAFFFGAIPKAGSYLQAAALYFLFCACATMDVVPRQILLTTIISKTDLIRVLGVVNIAKTFARCAGPVFTGYLAQANILHVGFYVNAACLMAADTFLGLSFGHLDRRILDLHQDPH